MEILSDYKRRHQFRLYSDVLMSNYIHLLIETGKAPLSKIQQGINQSFTNVLQQKV
jgi:REP element-mobilizing transposase RayT